MLLLSRLFLPFLLRPSILRLRRRRQKRRPSPPPPHPLSRFPRPDGVRCTVHKVLQDQEGGRGEGEGGGRGCRRPESVGRLRRWGGGGVSEMARRRGSEILLCMDVCDLRMSRMSFGCFAAPTHDGMAGVCGYCPNVDVFLRRAWAGIRDAVCFCDYCY